MNRSNIVSKIVKGIIALDTIVNLSGCDIGFEAKETFETQGIYLAAPDSGYPGPKYTFNSEDSTTLVLLGTNAGIEFKDIETGKKIRLYTSSHTPYKCTCIDTFKTK